MTMSKYTDFRRNLVSLSVAALFALGAIAASSAHADDDSSSDSSSDSDSKQALQLMKNLQALEASDSQQATYEAGFTFLQTFAGITGQPELTVGIECLKGVLDFTGAFSSSSSNASTTQALTALTANFKQLDSQVKAQGAQIDNLTQTLASKINTDLKDKVNTLHGNLQKEFNALYPPTVGNQYNTPRPNPVVAGGATTPVPSVSPAVARQVAHDIMVDLDTFIDSQTSLFTGEDIQTVYTNTGQQDSSGNPIKRASLQLAPGFKPYPALNVYLFGLQLWISAMEIESGGTDAGHQRILRDRGYNGQLAYPVELKRHITFLRALDANGVRNGNPTGVQPQIVQNVSCVWNADRYPDKSGKCTAVLACTDHISHKVLSPKTTTSWSQSGGNSYCNASFAPSADLDPTQNALRYQYGIPAMNKMADTLERVASRGTALQSSAPPMAGNFGGKSDSPFFVYAVDGSGAVNSYTGFRNQPLPQAVSAGSVGNVKALIAGGGTSFYTITSDGKLQWYQFSSVVGKANSGPVTLSTAFGGYKQVFGGGDGVIYAIQNDGTLVWFRHSGFANGGGATTMSGPKTVAAGFGKYKHVFAAGSGILYAIAPDGTLDWYRHKDYLTGASGATNVHEPAGNRPTAMRVEKGLPGPTELEGPISVGSGWADFAQIIPSGNGVVLAVQRDGTVLWYRHDDYLTGVSTAAASASSATQSSRTGTGQTPHEASTLESSWGNAKPAAGQPMNAPQWGTQPQARGLSGTSSAQGSLQGSLHNGVEAAAMHPGATSSMHAGATSSSTTSTQPTGIAARSNVGNATAMIPIPHWEGPITIAGQTNWGQYPEIAAVLPVTVQTNVIR
jgi:hypothetical protein